MSTENTLSENSLVNPETTRMPYAYYESMRREAPVHFDQQAGAFIVSKYADIQAAARMTDVLSNGLGLDSTMSAPWQDELDEMMHEKGFGPHRSGDNFNVDPPLHSRRRGLIDQALSGNAVAAMEPHIKTIVKELVDAFINRGHADLVDEYAIPVAIYVISDLLGVPREKRQEVQRWSDAAVAPFGQGLTREQSFAYAEDLMEMHRYLDGQFQDRRKNPGDDILSKLVHARIEGDENPTLTSAELLSCSVALLAAGNETTRNAMGWGIYILARDPALFATLKASLATDDKLVNRFVEETLRFEPSVPQLPRVAIEDCDIGGVSIPKGSLVLLCWASGNRDDDKFDMPDSFDIERKNIGQHLTFGHGVHRCVGAMLARMEMRCAFKEILARMSALSLADREAELDIWGTFVFRGLRSLKVTFKAH